MFFVLGFHWNLETKFIHDKLTNTLHGKTKTSMIFKNIRENPNQGKNIQ